VARKGWDRLSADYRARLERHGITRTQYDSGASLQKARGHIVPGGIGERRYRILRKLADKVSWPNTTAKDMVDTELQRGTDPTWLKTRLEEKAAAEQAYRQWLQDNGFRNWFDAKKAGKQYDGPGHRAWRRRRLSVGVEMYWYH
jgi:hypothetical protein